MITFYLKLIAISSLLILFYYLVLERQKNHHFKRFFLLGSLIFSLAIPFLQIPFGNYYIPNKTAEIALTPVTSSIIEAKNIDWTLILSSLYCLVVLLLIIRFIYQMIKLFQTRQSAKIIKHDTFDIALLTEKTTAFSFLNTIYINQNLYENQLIDESIFVHEQAHINQKHSYDIIFIEILKIIFWLNPAFYFYKKTISTNHEFLADDKALEHTNIKYYQEIIYREATSQHQYSFTQNFIQQNNTKKRFIMMNTSKNKTIKTRVFGSVLFTCGVAFLFAEKTRTPIFIETHNHIDAITEVVKHTSGEENLIGQGDSQAQFPGGMNELRNALAREFDISKFDNTFGKLSATVFLQIDKDGKSKIIKTEGLNKNFSQESQRSMEKVIKETVWVPAQKNGKAVDSELKIPFTMEFFGNGNTPPPPPPPPAVPSKKRK